MHFVRRLWNVPVKMTPPPIEYWKIRVKYVDDGGRVKYERYILV